MRDCLVIAGTFATQRVSDFYYASLRPTKVFALPNGGWGRLHRTYEAIRPVLLEWAAQQEQPIVLVGHSQGAIHAIAFAIEHPELVDSVIGIAGPFDGANGPAITTDLRRSVKRIIPVALDFQKGAPYLMDLQQRATLSTVSISLVAGATDRLVSRESAHAIDPADKVIHEGGHTTVLHQRATKHLLRELREK